jgi:hypothetical protein
VKLVLPTAIALGFALPLLCAAALRPEVVADRSAKAALVAVVAKTSLVALWALSVLD